MASRFYFLLSYVLPSFAYNMNYEAWLLNKKPPHFPLLFSLWMHKKDSPRILCHSSISKRSTRKWFNAPFFDTTPFFCCLHRKYLITLMHCFLLSIQGLSILVVVAMHTHSSWQCGLCVSWVTERLSRVSSLLDCSLSLPFLPPPTWGLCNYVYVTTWQWNPNTGNTLHQGIELLLAFYCL